MDRVAVLVLARSSFKIKAHFIDLELGQSVAVIVSSEKLDYCLRFIIEVNFIEAIVEWVLWEQALLFF